MCRQGGMEMEAALSLVKPDVGLQDEYLSFYREWKESGEQLIPWVISKDPSDFAQMVKWLQDNERGENIPEGWVPDSTYWLVADERRIVGAVNIRHALTERLFNAGGHIGYGIRPSERGKGYATELLRLALEKTRELGLTDILVVCDESNLASEKVIQKNGGVPDTPFVEEDGNVVKRYWIHL